MFRSSILIDDASPIGWYNQSAILKYIFPHRTYWWEVTTWKFFRFYNHNLKFNLYVHLYVSAISYFSISLKLSRCYSRMLPATHCSYATINLSLKGLVTFVWTNEFLFSTFTCMSWLFVKAGIAGWRMLVHWRTNWSAFANVTTN